MLRPDSNLTRAEMAAIMNRAFGAYQTADISQFRDVWSDKWYYTVGADYIHGNPQRQLTPRANITRAEFAQIFYNVITEYITSSGKYTYRIEITRNDTGEAIAEALQLVPGQTLETVLLKEALWATIPAPLQSRGGNMTPQPEL